MKSLFVFIAIVGIPAIGLAATGGEAHGPSPRLWINAMNFAILLGILIYYARKPIRELFQQRYDDFNKQAVEAAKTKKELDAQRADLEQRIQKLRQTKEESIAKAKTDAEKMYESEIAKAQAGANKIVSDAQGTVEADVKKLLEKLRIEALEMSVESAEEQLKSISKEEKAKLNKQFTTRVEEVSV